MEKEPQSFKKTSAMSAWPCSFSILALKFYVVTLTNLVELLNRMIACVATFCADSLSCL